MWHDTKHSSLLHMNTPKLQLIGQWLAQHGEPKFRLRQIHDAWFRYADWKQAHVLPPRLRTALAAAFPWSTISKSTVFTSPTDGTQKAILTFEDGQATETVLMPNAREKTTACISSQVGCGMGCTFCATGAMGLRRNLSADEMLDQLRFWNVHAPAARFSNVVLMGMGEPLANFEQVKTAVLTMIEELGMGPTRITLSTVGFRAGLKRLLEDATFPPIRIALSLHAATDKTRRKIVPSHAGTSMKELSAFAAAYVDLKSNRRHHLTLEYVMLWGVNDTPEQSTALIKFCLPIRHRVKVNLIPWNPTGAELQRSPQERLLAFQTALKAGGIATTIRYSKGLDIAGACGQLALQEIGKNMLK